MKIFKIISGISWFWFSFLCTITFYDYQKGQLTLENLTLLVPLIVLVIVDYIEFKQRDRNVNNNWSDRV